MEHVIFDGVDLASRFTCLVTSRPMPSLEANTEHVSGADYLIPRGASVLPQPIVVKLVMGVADEAARRDAAHYLGGILYAKEPKRLSLSSDDGLYCMAIVSGQPDMHELVRTGYVYVTFQPMHAALYGTTRTATIPSGGSVTVTVGGNYPTRPRVQAPNAIRNTSSGVWGIRLDEGDFIHVPLSATSRVDADSDTRVCTVNGAITMPTLDSSWLEMAPGTHTLRNDQGSGASTVTWIERWL